MCCLTFPIAAHVNATREPRTRSLKISQASCISVPKTAVGLAELGIPLPSICCTAQYDSRQSSWHYLPMSSTLYGVHLALHFASAFILLLLDIRHWALSRHVCSK